MDTKETEYQLLEKIIRELNNIQNAQEKTKIELIFTDQEVKALKRVAAREMAWAGVGMIAASYKQIITYMGFFIMAWLTFKGYLVEWIISILKR
jgi:intracellular sulfur oxidation DsrE/DsrF family protein